MAPDSQKPAVLVVDDSLVMRNLQKAALQKEGYAVTAVDSGPKALALLGLNGAAEGAPEVPQFELVLLDNMMPEMKGLEVLERIRASRPQVELPVIMVTANDESGDIVAALKLQANDYVTKPIDFPVLFARMETHIAFKKSHEDLRDSHRSLVSSAKMESVAALAAGVAHEISNPLAQIQMAVDGALGAVGDNGMAKEFLEMSAEAIKRADGIVTELVSYSTSTNLKLEPASLNEFVEEIVELMGEEFETYMTSVKTELADENPPAFMSKNELQQAFLNLLFNALQAMSIEGTLTIRTGTRVVEGLEAAEGSRTGAHVRNGEEAAFIEVEDTGPGITAAELAKVFDPFFTSKATGTGHGKGLGLTVARQLIELHGGAIQLENIEPGRGLRARVLLRCRETAML
jgi:two-component system, NtrC family, sensor kinase